MYSMPKFPRALMKLTAAVFLLAACGGDGGEAAGGATEDTGPAVDPATAGTVVGTIAFEGTPPAPAPVDMSEEPACADKHDGGYAKSVAVVNDGRLANVFVYVKEGLTGSFPTPSEDKELDQDGCVYQPHVMGVQTGQTLTIRNSDGLLHNINASPSTNRGFNISQPTNMTSTRTFSQPEIMIPVRCDVHGWMESYVGVLDHPYYAVTGEDGSFRIENLPAGDYVVEAWHERYGTQTMNVTVAAQEESQADFSFAESMAANAIVPLGAPLDPHDHHAQTRGPAHAAAAGR
ncbi:MAG TPA: carboxypeptidase regulatory-like domain-containing protein [Longimicrobiales bacterium]|nr:carboxypeptidase regulatory-like domain-containing protein [Longimicrobiales bacterium]